MTTPPQAAPSEADEHLDAMYDALHKDGFSREEDWFVKHPGHEYTEQIHIDTLAMLARAQASASSDADASWQENDMSTERQYSVILSEAEIAALADYHDCQQEEARCVGLHCTGNAARAKELREFLAAMTALKPAPHWTEGMSAGTVLGMP